MNEVIPNLDGSTCLKQELSGVKLSESINLPKKYVFWHFFQNFDPYIKGFETFELFFRKTGNLNIPCITRLSEAFWTTFDEICDNCIASTRAETIKTTIF